MPPFLVVLWLAPKVFAVVKTVAAASTTLGLACALTVSMQGNRSCAEPGQTPAEAEEEEEEEVVEPLHERETVSHDEDNREPTPTETIASPVQNGMELPADVNLVAPITAISLVSEQQSSRVSVGSDRSEEHTSAKTVNIALFGCTFLPPWVAKHINALVSDPWQRARSMGCDFVVNKCRIYGCHIVGKILASVSAAWLCVSVAPLVLASTLVMLTSSEFRAICRSIRHRDYIGALKQVAVAKAASFAAANWSKAAQSSLRAVKQDKFRATALAVVLHGSKGFAMPADRTKKDNTLPSGRDEVE